MSGGSRVALALLALLLLACAVICLRIALAASLATPAQTTLVRAEGGHLTDSMALATAALAVENARTWWGTAELEEMGSRIALRQAATSKLPGERRSAMDKARESALRATELRPTWPYAAAQLATVLHEDQDHGALFVRAAADAMRFGPNEMRVRRMLAQLWLDDGARSSAAAETLAAAFDAQLRTDPAQWIDRADRASVAPEACNRAQAIAAARERCITLGWERGTGMR